MSRTAYQSMKDPFAVHRRCVLKAGGLIGAGLLLGSPRAWAQEQQKQTPPPKPKTNVDAVLGIPRTEHSLPGAFPGRVVEVHDAKAIAEGKVDPAVVREMFERGLRELTGKDLQESWRMFFTPEDVVGIKVNPVGAGLINTHHELVEAVIAWLEQGGLPRGNIVIWDRFEGMLVESGYTPERYPGVRCVGLQMLDESAMEEGVTDDSKWRDENGVHRSRGNFDDEVFYWAEVDGPEDRNYLNQHVVADKHSYFGKLVTRELTRMINLPVFKNTGNGISMATKNLGYGAICNTGRLHRPLFFDVCTEVMAFPAIRDKLVLNVTDGLIGQYDGGPMPNAQFVYEYGRLFLATDPFALDRVCHELLLQKRKEQEVKVDEHPRFTDYLRYAERLGLGVGDLEKIKHVTV